MGHVAYCASDFPLTTGLKKTIANIKWMICSNRSYFSKPFYQVTMVGCGELRPKIKILSQSESAKRSWAWFLVLSTESVDH